MNKMKTNRGAAKRFRVTRSGKIKRGKAYASHILNKKSTKRKRQLRGVAYVSSVDDHRIHKLIPYK